MPFGIKKKRSLLLATDHLGLRPHYWCRRNKTLSFAYEVGALIAVNHLDYKLDFNALAQFMSYEYLLQERTWHMHEMPFHETRLNNAEVAERLTLAGPWPDRP